MKPFTLPALWTIWRCGVPEIGFEALTKFCGLIGESLEKIIEGLLEDDLIDVLVKLDREKKRYTFLQPTEKGLELVYADEEPRWREALQHITFGPPEGSCVQAGTLRRQGKKIREIALAMKLSQDRASVLSKQYERKQKHYQERVDTSAHFIAGDIPFKELSVDVMGPFSVRLANTLDRADIKTVPQLLATPSCRLLRLPNCGRKQIQEINKNLERCKATPLEWQYYDLKYFQDP